MPVLARQSRPRPAIPWASIQAGSVRTRSSCSWVCGFSTKPITRPRIVHPHDAQAGGVLAVDRDGGDGHVGLGAAVQLDHLAVVHAVELVAGEDQHLGHAGLLQVAEVLPHGVGRALVPVAPFHGLLSGEDLHEPPIERIEVVGAADVAVQADGIELGQHVDAVQSAVDAVGQGDVDQPVLARQRHGGLRSHLGQRIESRATSAAQHQRHDLLHEAPYTLKRM